MATRSYDQFCALARALDVIGERWTLLIVRELLLGPRRFTDLLEGLPGIGTNLLAARLKKLERAGLIAKRTLPRPASASAYELTEDGRELGPAVLELARWGAKRLGRLRARDTFRPGWGALAMLIAFRSEAAAGVHDTYEFRIADEVFHVRIDDGRIESKQGPAESPDLVFESDAKTFVAVGTGRLDPQEAVASGRAAVRGEPEVLLRSLRILAPLGRPDTADSPSTIRRRR